MVPPRCSFFRLGFFLAIASMSLPSSSPLQVSVCQNKDCCSRWKHTTPLPEVLSDMLGGDAHTEVATTSCLGQCGNGPNVCVHAPKLGDMYLRGLEDATMAAAHLEALTDVQIPSKLLAAVNVLEKAQRATSSDDKERFLSSVINALSNCSEFSRSTALIRALILRAEMYFNEEKEDELSRAELDVERAISLLDQSKETSSTLRLGYQGQRLLADIRESRGDIQGAVEALEVLASSNRSTKTKVKLEIERLRQKVAP